MSFVNFVKNTNRNQNIICVVQNPKDISVIESMQQYNGVYHVLDGLINTQKGVLPDQLNIMTLLNRVNEKNRRSYIGSRSYSRRRNNCFIYI